MKFLTLRISALGGLTTLGLLAGCGQNGSWFSGQKKTTQVSMHPPASKPADTTVDFGGGVPDGDRPLGIVGIYGEQISATRTPSGFGDGSSNISQITFAAEGADFDPDVDPTGEWIYFSSTQHRSRSDLYRTHVQGSTITQLTSDPADDMMPEVSPNGSMLAFCSNRAGNWDIYVMPVSGGTARIITTDSSDDLHPSWSPDGRTLVYSKFTEAKSRWELWTVDVNNTSVHNFIDYGFLPEWSPDPANNKILFQRAKERGSRYHSIWTIDLVDGQGRNPTEITSSANAAIINPSWAPDGQHIVFVTVLEPDQDSAMTPTQSDVWVVGLDGTGRINLTHGDFANFQPTWGRDGSIYFVSDRGGNENLWSVAAQWASPDGSTTNSGMANVPTGN